MSVVRVNLILVSDYDLEWKDLSFDLILGEDGRPQAIETFGRWGKPHRPNQPESRSFWPFMILAISDEEGRQMFDGGQHEDGQGQLVYTKNERFAYAKVRDRKPVVGNSVVVEYDDSSIEFQITKIFSPVTGRDWED
jgi:hypothetical protein